MTRIFSIVAVVFCISTHILTKRMTCPLITLYSNSFISTHILTKRMTTGTMEASGGVQVFQLTSSRRGWRFCPRECTTRHAISTHILTKRMTQETLVTLWTLLFQLTSSRRGWLILFIIKIKELNFNSHPHEEDDTVPITGSSWLRNFNSHPHEEDDDNLIHHFNPSFLFQLTSSRRGWRSRFRISTLSEYFNSHPHEEDDKIPWFY